MARPKAPIVRSPHKFANPLRDQAQASSLHEIDVDMDSYVPRYQVRMMTFMVILMWWSYIEWIRPVMLPPRHEKRLVFPPGVLDPHAAYRYFLYPRA